MKSTNGHGVSFIPESTPDYIQNYEGWHGESSDLGDRNPSPNIGEIEDMISFLDNNRDFDGLRAIIGSVALAQLVLMTGTNFGKWFPKVITDWANKIANHAELHWDRYNPGSLAAGSEFGRTYEQIKDAQTETFLTPDERG